MGEVIELNFGADKKDIDLLSSIFTYAGVDAEGYKADKQFSNLSAFSLSQEKAIRFSYEKMGDYLYKLQENFYKNGQSDRDLKLMNDFRELLQEYETMICETMRINS